MATVIGIAKVSLRMSKEQVEGHLKKAIPGDFKVLKFVPSKGKMKRKIAYIQLASNLNPAFVVAQIRKKTSYIAFIPNYTPDLSDKPQPGPHGKKFKMQEQFTPEQVLVVTHGEIMVELQSIYTGLYNLSRKTDHKLLDSLGHKVLKRLKHVTNSFPDIRDSCFMLSKRYRTTYPHSGDSLFIQSTLNELQTAAGVTRTRLQEQDLILSKTHQPFLGDDLPYEVVKQACTKYSNRIIKKILEHIKYLDAEKSNADNEEDECRKRVRLELKNMSQYIPMIVNQVISYHFVPQKTPFLRFRMYGEPAMPSKDHTIPLLKRHQATRINRSDRMYNMLRFNIPMKQYSRLMTLDGTLLNGAKILIRLSDIPLHPVSRELVAKIHSTYGATGAPPDLPPPADDDDDGGDAAGDDCQDEWDEAMNS